MLLGGGVEGSGSLLVRVGEDSSRREVSIPGKRRGSRYVRRLRLILLACSRIVKPARESKKALHIGWFQARLVSQAAIEPTDK